MSDRPIIFSGPMVRALLDGRKTQTRRLIRANIPDGYWPAECHHSKTGWGLWKGMGVCAGCTCQPVGGIRFNVDDRLYVRENGAFSRPDGLNMYQADMKEPRSQSQGCKRSFIKRWTPSIHMPRWASRLTLTVTDVRVQRLQDISEADAIAEGVCSFVEGQDSAGAFNGLTSVDRSQIVQVLYGSNLKAFQHLWESLHGCDSWQVNPWLVALTFTVEQQNIDHTRAA